MTEELQKDRVGTEPAAAGGKPVGKSGPSGTLFSPLDYMPFMLGVFLVGGLAAMPLTYGLGTGLSYLESLPWSLASCVVFLVAFRKNGTISWARAIPAIIAIMVAANVYNQSTGKPAFAAGGVAGFVLVLVCGYVGVGIGRLLGRWG